MTKVILDFKPGNDLVTFSFVIESRSMQAIGKATATVMAQLGVKETDLIREPYFVNISK